MKNAKIKSDYSTTPDEVVDSENMMVENTNTENIKSVDVNERMQESYIWGWQDGMEVAKDVWCSIHSTLLKGNLIFAFKNTGSLTSDLVQFVIVRNNALGSCDYSIGLVTAGYTMLLPHVPLSYFSDVFINDLIKWKLNKNILEVFKQVIKSLEE